MIYDHNDNFVQGPDVINKMRNALVEVHFRIKHYRINGDSDAFDSFSGLVEQVVILQPGRPKAASPYKDRLRAHQGPYRPQPPARAKPVSKPKATRPRVLSPSPSTE
jgi:hypothetical protein